MKGNRAFVASKPALKESSPSNMVWCSVNEEEILKDNCVSKVVRIKGNN